ncbi:MAG: DUF2637 domain-containing protein [Streptosporangiaceae bacterium]
MTWNRTAILAALPVAAVAVIAGIVSFSHIEALGLRTGQSLTDARLLPLAVDGLIVAGSVILLAGSWLGWIGVSLGVAGTVYANVMSGLPRGPLAATVAAWPALAFTVASFMLERWLAAQSATVPAAVPAEANGHDPDVAAFAGELARGEVPTIRRIRAELHVGQPRAQEIRARLSALARTP